MVWLALQFDLDAPQAGAFSDALLELGAHSVTIEDADRATGREQPVYDETGPGGRGAWPRNRLTALVTPQTDPAALLGAAAQAIGLEAAPPYALDRIEEEDWVRRAQAQFAPQRVGRRLWIVPSWCAPPAAEDAIVIRLDPGLAFGTGSHPSTRLVLEWLERTLGDGKDDRAPSLGGARVLDYGCGSGILALAAAKLGAREVVAIDQDPQALATSRANAAANGLALEVAAPATLPQGTFDLIAANILAAPLAALAPLFAARARRGARIALSGVLENQAAALIDAYTFAFALEVERVEEGWALVAGRRR